jgi:hypothetical protein
VLTTWITFHQEGRTAISHPKILVSVEKKIPLNRSYNANFLPHKSLEKAPGVKGLDNKDLKHHS